MYGILALMGVVEAREAEWRYRRDRPVKGKLVLNFFGGKAGKNLAKYR